ncbi:MAG: DciA family protein [Rhodospirillaceae bacterium]
MREKGFRAVGGLAQRLTSGLTEKRSKSRGTSIARLRVEWTAIVGAELAGVTQPDALLAGRGPGKVLRLKVEGAAALEVQHRAGQIVERLNAYFGHRMIDDIRLVQAPLSHKPPPRVLPQPDAPTMQRIESSAAEVEDPELRAALVRLGARIAASRRGVVLGLFGAALLPRAPRAQEGADKLLGVLPTDHVLGKADAPNIIIDYFSLTCPHCANFHAAVLPQVKREWIDTGRARFVYRNYPSDSIATRASLLAECGGAKYFETIDALFKSQVEWLTAEQPEEELVKVVERAGLPARDCVSDGRLFDKVVGDVQSGQALGVKFTPTLFINEQKYGNPEGGVLGIDAILRQVGR